MIERYLEELRRELGWWPKRRLLAELEDHLRSAAADVGEEEAIRRFGDAAAVARAYRSTASMQRSALLAAAALAFPVLQYPIVENSLPPAPWPSAADMPPELVWKLEAILWLLPVALAAGIVAAVAYRRARRLFVAALATSLACLATTAALGSVLQVQWQDRVPWAPPALQLLAPVHFVLIAAAAFELARGVRLSRG